MTSGRIAQRVYDWERINVEPKAQEFLSKDDCMDLVARASSMAGIPVPHVRFAKAASMPCRAEPSQWRIVVADWGRTPVTILHEVAHLATVREVARGEDPHGPSFLGQAIRYYSALLGLEERKMLDSSAAAGLEAKLPARRVQPRRSEGFSEVEF